MVLLALSGPYCYFIQFGIIVSCLSALSDIYLSVTIEHHVRNIPPRPYVDRIQALNKSVFVYMGKVLELDLSNRMISARILRTNLVHLMKNNQLGEEILDDFPDEAESCQIQMPRVRSST